jgi:transcriptional regulator with XRE-family HTH domain
MTVRTISQEGPAAAIRGYIVRLREARGVTQEELAGVVDLKRRAYIDWETGRTGDLKAAGMCAAFRYLGGSFEHLRDMARPSATRADGVELAEMRLREEVTNELVALQDTMSSSEYDDYLIDIEREALNQSQVVGLLRARLRRYAR